MAGNASGDLDRNHTTESPVDRGKDLDFIQSETVGVRVKSKRRTCLTCIQKGYLSCFVGNRCRRSRGVEADKR